MKFKKSHLLNLTMIVALIATAFVGYRLSPLLLPKADAFGVVEPGCDLQRRACPASLPQGRMELSITPRPIPFLQPLRVEASFIGIEPKKVEADFAGESMNMGYNRSQLTATGAGRHAGEASLPVCVSGSMAWVVTIIIETDRQRIVVPYRFDAGR